MPDAALTSWFFSAQTTSIYHELITFNSPVNKGFVRNAKSGIISNGVSYEYLPFRIRKGESRNNVDYEFFIDFAVADNILLNNYIRYIQTNPEPTLTYSIVDGSDNNDILFGPITMSLGNVIVEKSAASLAVNQRDLSRNRTGEIYDLDRFPSLQGFLQ